MLIPISAITTFNIAAAILTAHSDRSEGDSDARSRCCLHWRSAVSAAAPAQAQTYGSNYPVCLHVFGQISYYDCRYASLAQCNLSASGRSAQCEINPYAANAVSGDGPVRKRARRAD